MIVTRYSPLGVLEGIVNVTAALPPDIVQVPKVMPPPIGATAHVPVSTGLNPKPVTATVKLPLVRGKTEFGEIVS